MCRVDQCPRDNYGKQDLCHLHYQRKRRTGDPKGLNRLKGGKDCSYHNAHQRVYARYGPAKKLNCAHCWEDIQAEEWAYNHKDKLYEKFQVGKGWFSPDPDYYIPLCKGCHRKLDRSYEDEFEKRNQAANRAVLGGTGAAHSNTF